MYPESRSLRKPPFKEPTGKMTGYTLEWLAWDRGPELFPFLAVLNITFLAHQR